jgi:multiple sugar transport system substrate-binding protein
MKNQITVISLLGGALFLASPLMAQTELSMWYHGAGNEVESKIINQVVGDFNASQSDWEINLESFPQESYNDSIIAAALAGDLPDIIDVDGPIMPNWAWSGYMQPLPIDESKFDDFLPGTKGYWNGKLYSIGLWDAAVALYARQSTLDELGLRMPTVDNPWTGEEFMAALDAAKASGKFEYAFDPGMAWTGEWYPYAFSPFLQSFGGDIVDRSTYQTAEGVLNGDDAIAFGNWWQGLFANDLAPGTSQSPADRDTAFIQSRRVSMTSSSCLRPISATATSSVRHRGSSASQPHPRIPMARQPLSNSRPRTSTSQPSRTGSASPRRLPARRQ